MKKNKLFTLITITIASLLTIFFMGKPIINDLNFGLDLQGGFEVLYEVTPIDGDELTNEMLTSTYKAIVKRIDVLGVSEPEITIEGTNRIRVQLAGVTDEESARRILSKTASLTFRDTNDELLMTSEVLGENGAKLTTDDYGNPAIALNIEDVDLFYETTNKVKDYEVPNNRIVIWLDYTEGEDSYSTTTCGVENGTRCLSAATVSQAFASDVRITGSKDYPFKQEEATELVNLINSGALPTQLTEISSNSVSASLGESALNSTTIAGLIGLLLVIITMAIIYKVSGLISSLGILIYAFLTFAVFYLIDGVLTLPGIAAIILGIGMAVDANVITYERIKDEIYEGRSIKSAFKTGYQKSLSSIIDANVTTFLVAVILFFLGESSVKGFATMLIISIIISVFVMVFVTRAISNLLLESGYFNKNIKRLFGVSKDDVPNINKNEKRKKYNFKNIDFVSKRKKFFIISSSIILVGAILLSVFGLKLGVDYQGGTSIVVQSKNNLEENILVEDLKELNYVAEDITLINNSLGANIVIKGEISQEETATIKTYFEEKYGIEPNITVVSHVVKRELTKNAIYALIFASIGIIIYISLRFKLSYALAAIIALVHDAFIVIAAFSILRLEVNSIFIAAILAIIGYSINDTIVSFDKIRENRKLHPDISLEETVNKSLRETLLRSIYTSVTTLLPILALILFGSFEIINFNIALFIGLIAGTYSSIFIASQIWIYLERKIKSDHDDDDHEIKELEVHGINK